MHQINKICEAVERQLKGAGYRKRSIDHHLQRWNKLIRYMAEREVTVYTSDVGLTFLKDIYEVQDGTLLDDLQKKFVHSVKLLNDYVGFGTIYPKSSPTSMVKRLTKFGEELEAFKKYRKEKHCISAIVLSAYDKQVGRVLLYLENQGLSSLSDLTAVQVYDCCKMFAQMVDAVAYSMASAFRIFLRYLHMKNITAEDFSLTVPSFSRYRKCKLPSTLDTKEITDLLDGIDRAGPGGKRDYAIILLACRLGMRAGDIRTLRFCDIDWEQNTISIITQKTRQATKFPLLGDIGEALIDYIKNARPITDNPIIFQSFKAPIQPLSSPALWGVVQKHANKAGVNMGLKRHIGTHIFRHTLASNLLKANVPVTAIADVLTHKSPETTAEYYLRIDINQLKRCMVEPPPFLRVSDEEVF